MLDSIRNASFNSALRESQAGISRGLGMATEAARQIASATTAEPADLTNAAVTLLQAKAQVQASAKAMRTVDKALGSLLDVRA